MLLALWCLLWLAGPGAHAQSLEGVLSPGVLSNAHAKLESECSACHKYFSRNAQDQLCSECHKPVAEDIRAASGYHGRLEDKTCRTCHAEHKGANNTLIVLDKKKFNHDQTDWPLHEAHANLGEKCESCHVAGKKYRQAPLTCNGCHAKDDVHKGKLGEKCTDCHNEKKWKDVKFDHDKTHFKLEGGHAKLQCKACHSNNLYKDTPRDCFSCHKSTDNKSGHHGRYGPKCATCHTVANWKEVIFSHDRDTHYPLKAKHAEAKCDACHKGILYQEKLATTCVSCHRKDDNERGHKGTLGDKCETCHAEQGWKQARFDHERDTKFKRIGKHVDAKCEACHKSGVTAVKGVAPVKPPQQCYGCHKSDDDAKGHKGQFGEKCDTCHNNNSWKESRFDHNRDTPYVRRGKHITSVCAACHTGPLYGPKLSQECVSCHRKDDQEKGHRGTQGTRCADCHSESNWKVEKFDHNKSVFPLLGKHVRVECKNCHATVRFKEAAKTCIGCHDKDDVHKRRLGTDCETCHNARSWKSWDFNHNKTRFRLEGAHSRLECQSCHKEVLVKGKSMGMTCISCHAKDDIHRGSFGLECQRCHSNRSWLDTPRTR